MFGRKSFKKQLEEVWSKRVTPGAIVLATLSNPPEKVWGLLLEMKPEGISIEGNPVEVFDELIERGRRHEPLDLETASVFYPMHRIERVERDNDNDDGPLALFFRRFQDAVGVTVQEYMKSKKG